MTGWSDLLHRMQVRPAIAAKRPAASAASETFWSIFRAPPGGRSGDPVGGANRRSFEGVRNTREPQTRPASDDGDLLVMPSVEPAEIAQELSLSRFASVRALQRLRRDFAAKNHPDRVPVILRGRATKRMMIANAMIDSAMKRFRLNAVRADAPDRPQPAHLTARFKIGFIRCMRGSDQDRFGQAPAKPIVRLQP